jgi:hypothetical protein
MFAHLSSNVLPALFHAFGNTQRSQWQLNYASLTALFHVGMPTIAICLDAFTHTSKQFVS